MRCLEGDDPLPPPCAPVGFSTIRLTCVCWLICCEKVARPTSSWPVNAPKYERCLSRAMAVCLDGRRCGCPVLWAKGAIAKRSTVFGVFSASSRQPTRTVKARSSASSGLERPWRCSLPSPGGGGGQRYVSGGTSPTPKSTTPLTASHEKPPRMQCCQPIGEPTSTGVFSPPLAVLFTVWTTFTGMSISCRIAVRARSPLHLVFSYVDFKAVACTTTTRSWRCLRMRWTV